jgi:hypothetical protein
MPANFRKCLFQSEVDKCFGICTLINLRFGHIEEEMEQKGAGGIFDKECTSWILKEQGLKNNSKTLGIVLYIGWNVIVNKTWLKDSDFFTVYIRMEICFSVQYSESKISSKCRGIIV